MSETARKLLDLFKSLDTSDKGYVEKKAIFDMFESRGISTDDPRLERLFKILNREGISSRYNSLSGQSDSLEHFYYTDNLNFDEFSKVTQQNLHFIERILTDDLIIPNFGEFRQTIEGIYKRSKRIRAVI